MSIVFKKYKRIFRHNLQPMFALLVARRKVMEPASWTAFVNETLQYVVNNPVEYLGDDLPSDHLTKDIIDDIRMDFFKEMSAFNSVPRH